MNDEYELCPHGRHIGAVCIPCAEEAGAEPGNLVVSHNKYPEIDEPGLDDLTPLSCRCCLIDDALVIIGRQETQILRLERALESIRQTADDMLDRIRQLGPS